MLGVWPVMTHRFRNNGSEKHMMVALVTDGPQSAERVERRAVTIYGIRNGTIATRPSDQRVGSLVQGEHNTSRWYPKDLKWGVDHCWVWQLSFSGAGKGVYCNECQRMSHIKRNWCLVYGFGCNAYCGKNAICRKYEWNSVCEE
eukprot:TRINITY_DN12414_c0_g1_i1.p1 TRINITY_DN12414_c0_g1~~TRINITY_DN12414_c0_g1_i1.p1  ORF type:complete len:144 (+),score=2.45 TRINITY_DN12414_c0_g1_i1:119-550(+)